jgi:hypothetical protein
MKRTILILSLAFAGCKTATPFPNVPVYVNDIKHGVCAEYEIIDVQNFKVKLKAEHDISKCQGVVGFDREGFKKVQNWARDEQNQAKSLDAAQLRAENQKDLPEGLNADSQLRVQKAANQ